MADRHNPYIAGAPVVEQRMFFGREGVFNWIEHSLSGKYVDHILVLHGQRRVGKTSVLKHIPNRLPSRYIPIFIDLQGRVSTSLGRFLGWLAREITRALKENGIELPRPDRSAFEEDPDYFENVFLPSITSHLGERTLLLTFDEFDTFESTDAQEGLAIPFMAILKRLMDHPNLSFIFSIGSSGRKLENMQAAYTSFFKQALYRKISFLEPDDARQLVIKPVEGGVSYSDEAVDRILSVTHRHPYFVQLICHELFSECLKNDQWDVSLSEVNAVLDPVVERGTVNLKFVWDEADDLEKWILAILATVEDGLDLPDLEARLKAEQVRYTRQELERALLRLRDKDVITPDNQFVIFLLKLWLQRNRPMEQVREELEEVNPIVNRLLEIGQEYHNKGEYLDAVRSFDEVLKVDAANLDARLWLGSSQLARGDYGKAIAEFEAVLAVKIDDVVAQKGYCDAYLAMGDESRADGKLEEAEFAYQQVLGVNPEHELAQHRMAEIHHRRAVEAIVGGPEAALEELEKALEYAEEDAFRQARDQLMAFLAGDRKLKDVLLSWGQTAQEIGLWDEAQDLLDAYRQESGDEQTVSRAITEIREHVIERRREELRQRAARLTGLNRFEQAADVWNSYLLVAPEESAEIKARITQLQAQAKSAVEKRTGLSPMMRIVVTGLIVILFGAIVWLLAQPTSPLRVAMAGSTANPTRTLAPTPTMTATLVPTTAPTITPTPQPTAIPMSWSRVSSVSFLDRDEVNQIVIDPNDPDVMYAGTEYSGVYKTINGGVTWEPAQNGMEGNRINSLIIHPTNSEILYAGVLDDGPYKTTDGGKTWEKLEYSTNPGGLWQFTSEITLNPNNPDEIYFTDGNNIYFSDTAGNNWRRIWENGGEGKENSPLAELSVSPDGKLYYTGPWRSYTVGRIDPETKEVEKFADFNCDLFSCASYDSSVTFSEETGRMFVEFKDDLYYSEDGGESWQNTNLYCQKAEFDGNGNGLCLEQRPYITFDGGLTWSSLNYPNDFQTITGAISPHDPDTIVLAGRYGLYKSTDRGLSWENISNGIGNGQIDLKIDPANNLLYLRPQPGEGNFGDIYAAPIGSRTFDLIWSVPEGEQIFSYLSPDGRWYHFYTPDKSGVIMFSSDNGPFKPLPIKLDPQAMNSLGEAGGFILDGVEYLYAGPGDSEQILYITSDEWNTWETIEYQNDQGVYSIFADPSNNNNLYSIGMTITYSDDGGKTWTQCGSSEPDFWQSLGMWPPGTSNIFSLDPREDGSFFYTTTSEGLVKNISPDCSRLKKILPGSGLDNHFTTSVMRHPENPDIIYVGTANGFFVSFNNGETWGTANEGLLGAQTIYSLAVDPNDPDTVYAATPYGIFKLEGK